MPRIVPRSPAHKFDHCGCVRAFGYRHARSHVQAHHNFPGISNRHRRKTRQNQGSKAPEFRRHLGSPSPRNPPTTLEGTGVFAGISVRPRRETRQNPHSKAPEFRRHLEPTPPRDPPQRSRATASMAVRSTVIARRTAQQRVAADWHGFADRTATAACAAPAMRQTRANS